MLSSKDSYKITNGMYIWSKWFIPGVVDLIS